MGRCYGKSKFLSKHSAKIGLRHMIEDNGVRGLVIYRCVKCGCWHLGSPPLMPFFKLMKQVEEELKRKNN